MLTQVREFITRHVDKGGNDSYFEDYRLALEVYNKKTMRSNYWPTNHDCDATLWAGLASYGGSSFLDIKEARDLGGRWHRRPLVPHGPCNVDGCDHGSKSTISNDMLLGVLFALRNDRDAMESLWSYAKDNCFIMGRPLHRVGEVILKPNVVSLLRGILGKKINLPPLYTSGGADYVKHLTAISIHLYGIIHGYIEGHHLQVLKSLTSEDPSNATFEAIKQRYTKRDYDRAATLMRMDVLPSYVRGSDNYALVYKLFTWKVIAS